MTRFVVRVLVAILAIGSPTPAFAYLKFGVRVGGNLVDIRWNRTIAYFVTDRGVPGVPSTELRDAIGRAFSTWQGVSSAVVRSQFQSLTNVLPDGPDGRTTFGFVDRPDLDRVLGATNFFLDQRTGEIIEADVFFNARFSWSTATNGEAGRMDLQSVALHEIGHLLGLGHSALGETEISGGGRRVLGSGAVMFPIALRPDRSPTASCSPTIARASTIFTRRRTSARRPAASAGASPRMATACLARMWRRSTSRPARSSAGFHSNPTAPTSSRACHPARTSSAPEPLDDADTDSFFSGPVDVDFRVAYGARVVIAPAGGSSEPVNIQVRPK